MVTKFLLKSIVNRPFLWGGAIFISLGLLSLVVFHADSAEALTILENVSWSFLGLSFVFLVFEGIATALRLWLFAQRKTCLSEALKANAWYVLLLVVLPARLGEVAAIVVLERYLGQKYGAAAMSIIVQRLYDVIILGIFFLIALLGIGDFIDKAQIGIIAFLLILFSIFILIRLDLFLSWAAILFKRVPKNIYRFILQARLYSRHKLCAQDVPLALLFSLFKWIGNLSALVFLFIALNLDLEMFENLIVAAAYNFLAIIPLQTVGGIGVGEAGLMLFLVGAGLTSGLAASASLMIRFVVLIFPFAFWIMVMGGLALKERLKL